MNKQSILWLGDHIVSKHQLSFNYGINDLRFNCTYWFQTINLLDIKEKYGDDYFEMMIFHSMAFEANKLCSLKPDIFELRQYEKYYTKAFENLWRTIFYNVWGQWRYQNDYPDYKGPQIVLNNSKINSKTVEPISILKGDVEGLLFCGGGKDSLASMTILDKISMKYDALVYTNSIYGSASKQLKIIKPLLSNSNSNNQVTQFVFDDFLESPVLTLQNELSIKELIAAETPSSIFSSLFWVLGNNYSYIILGHERSADFGNFHWNKTNEEINHQWGKSTEAEELINSYIQKYLISNIKYFSILKPLYDAGIFQIANSRKELIKYTHSCNIEKPWCCKCAKCAYVWLCFMAYMPIDEINQMFFNKNLLDDEDNQMWFRQLLGLTYHTPFECVGKKEEVRLAFELLKRKGYTGMAMEVYQKEINNEDFMKIVDQHLVVDEQASNYPEEYKDKIIEYLKDIVYKRKTEICAILSK